MTPDLRDIVDRLGGKLLEGGRAALVPGPNHSRHDRSLSLRLVRREDGSDRVLFYSHANDTYREVMGHLGLAADDVDTPASREERDRLRALRERERERQEAKDRAFCGAIWDGARPLAGSPAQAYLRSRGLDLNKAPSLRFHAKAPRCKPRAEPPMPAPLPAMVAAVCGPDRVARALHVTFIKPDGSAKAFSDGSKIMFGSVRGCAVQLAPIADDGTLAVAEGIESALSYTVLHRVPTWALLSTSGFANFVLPYRVKRLIIAADNDDNRAGLRAAEALAKRVKSKCAAEIHSPEAKDWNDQLRGRQ